MSSEILRRRLGRIGIWSFRFEALDPYEAAEAATEIERLDFPSLWVPEVGRTEAMSLAGHLLGSTSELVVGNGIARISDRSASATAAAHRYLDASSEGRHVLGLGLGRELSTADGPVDIMSSYLDEFTAAWDANPGESREPLMCLAAYNQKMADLAGNRTAGVHTYLVNDAHTAAVRATVGSEPVIAAEMAIVLTDDVELTRQIGRAHLATYIGSSSHQRKFKALGFDDSDFADGGSDALIDALVVGGDAAVTERIRAHHKAGADHVCLQVLGTHTLEDDVRSWAHLASVVATV